MKAKIKQTGEIVEVENLFDDGTALINDSYYKVSELDFDSNSVIDWEQRRYEIAKECASSLSALEITINDIVRVSIEIADALIEELKKSK